MNTKPESQSQATEWWSSLDPQWQAIFKAAIGIKSEPTEKELMAILSLTTLNCGFKRLTSLESLRALTGLQTLDCSGNPLTSLEPLRALTSLQTLDCRLSRLTSLEPLRVCLGLQTLVCSLNHLTSLEPLYGLKSLKKFECRSNPFLSPPELERFQKAVPSCQEVNLVGRLIVPPQVDKRKDNRWSWWSSLDPQWQAIFKAAIGIKNEPTEKELVAILSLTKLTCDRKKLTSLEPLRALTDLRTLDCSVNQLTRLEGLRTLTGLQTLDCNNNYLISLEPLQACTGLQKLVCGDNKLISLEPLRALTSLQTLDCRFNRLTSLEPLPGLKSLRKLDCRSNLSLSVEEIERFQKAVPSCQVSPTAEDQEQIDKIEVAKRREIDKIVPANNHFGFRLFKQLLQQDQGNNVFMSPPSIALVLAMAYNGAAGNTQKAMAKTLGLENLTLEEVNQANRALQNVLLHQSNPDMSLLIANSLWLNQDFRFEPTFLTQIQQCYAANVTNADFQSPATVSDINQWINENTRGKIGPVVQSLDPLTVLLLINAIYFKGKWAKQFDKKDTKERDFTLLTGKNKRTPMMYHGADYHYYQGNNYQAVRLPYRGSEKQRISMTIFLPNRGIPLENFPLLDHWQECRTCGNLREGTIVLPRFKVEYDVALNEALETLGMAEAFTRLADFSQIAKVPKGQYIYISGVKHKALVEVNEEGTVAAAVTYNSLECTSVANPIPPFKMIVDHPFFFTIQDDGTGTVLFLGAIVEPK